VTRNPRWLASGVRGTDTVTPMKWLLTVTPGTEASGRYAAWIRSVGVESDLVGARFGSAGDPGRYSALLLTGGGDVNPSRYGQKPHAETQDINDERDTLEMELIQSFLKTGKPVFGVCRGIQVLNVALGGKLIQHIPTFLGNRELHLASGTVDARHTIRLQGESELVSALREVCEVNSTHHQAVDPGAVGRGLQIVAVSPAGIIEAVEGRGLASVVLAVQWHPERLAPADPASEKLLDLMVRLCAGPASSIG